MVALSTKTSNADDAGERAAPLQSAVRAIPAQFELAYRSHYRDVYRYVLGLTRSIEETDDIVAETFERALRAWAERDLLDERQLPWLLLAARRLTTDRWRRARRLVRLLPRVVVGSPTGAGEPSELPSGGISKAQAIELAAAHVADAAFVSASAGAFRDLNLDPAGTGPDFPVKPDRLVWAVRYAGQFAICNPLGVCHSPVPGTAVVYLDYLTGAFLVSVGRSGAP